MERDLSRLNKLINIVDSYDDPEDMNILQGIAINVDDLEPFLDDVVDLALNKYGAATYGELLDLDPNDDVIRAAIAQYGQEQVDKMIDAAERIMRGE